MAAGATNVSGPAPTSGGAKVAITPTFTIPPTATISAPRSRGAYSVGQYVQTAFSCAEAAGAPGLASCVDSNGTRGGKGHLVFSAVGTFT